MRALVAAWLALALPGVAAAGSGVISFVDTAGSARIANLPPVEPGAGLPAAAPERRSRLWPIIEAQARAHGLDPALVDLVVRMESGYDTRAVSPKGARGAMQLLPATGRALGVADLFDPVQNIRGGVRYLRSLLDRFDSDLRLALAAYNAGPEAVEKHRGVPPYSETRRYVSAILSAYGGSDAPRLGGGFGRTTPARPVELLEDGGGRLLSNARRTGEPPIVRRLALQ